MSTTFDMYLERRRQKPVKHYGVKGMRWGIRRSRAVLARARAGKAESDDAKEARAIALKVKKSGTKSLTNAEMQKLTTRLNLENNLANANKTVLQRGEKRVKRMLSYGTTMNNVIDFANTETGRMVSRALMGPPKGQRVKGRGKAKP